jgi:hypothetical protein
MLLGQSEWADLRIPLCRVRGVRVEGRCVELCRAHAVEGLLAPPLGAWMCSAANAIGGEDAARGVGWRRMALATMLHDPWNPSQGRSTKVHMYRIGTYISKELRGAPWLITCNASLTSR